MKLIIFDLDQTLVDVISLHDRATAHVFREFFQANARLTEIDFAGRSLAESFVVLGRLKGLRDETIREKSNCMLESYERYFIDNFPKNPSRYVLPGGRRLLSALSRTENVLALYTGGSEKIGKKVLQATGLVKYFRSCAFGDQAETRPGMVRLLLNRVGKQTGKRFKGREVVIVGDSVRDVDCGKEFNALTIAVATGTYSERELAERGADRVFSSLRDYREVKSAILGVPAGEGYSTRGMGNA